MPAVPFVKVVSLSFAFSSDFCLSGIKIVLEKILLQEIFSLNLLAFFFLPAVNPFLGLLDHFVEIIWINRLQNIFCHSVADCFLRKTEITVAAEDHDL